jgi:hypothetical protein
MKSLPPGHDIFLFWTGFTGPVAVIGMAKRKDAEGATAGIELEDDGYAIVRYPLTYVEATVEDGQADVKTPGAHLMRILLLPIIRLAEGPRDKMRILPMGYAGPVTCKKLRDDYLDSVSKLRAEAAGISLPR